MSVHVIKSMTKSLLIGFAALTGLCQQVQAVSLDGTTGTCIYESALYAFSNGDFARGFVRLNGGFSIPAASAVNFNVLAPVAGPIALNATGKIVLEGDMHLAANALIASGGLVDGADHVLFLDGDLSIPAGEALTIKTNTVIDGQGHQINFVDGSPGGRLIVDGSAGTTLTLRNMILSGVKSYSNLLHALQFGAMAGQKIVLQNVVMVLDGIFIFIGGALDIKDDVLIQAGQVNNGQIFVYQASADLTIKSRSMLTCGLDTIFYYLPLDLQRTHLVFQDSSSKLFLDGMTLITLQVTGLKLQDGHVIIDNKVTFLSDNPVAENKGISFGTGTASQDLTVTIRPGARIELVDSFLTYANDDGA